MVEQYWRDNRLNMIHEGTHGIQGLDLLGRKVVMHGGAGLKLLAARVSATIERAGHVAGLAENANALAGALQRLGAATKSAWATGVPEEALANATPYLQGFGHVVLAWIWLDVALAADRALDATPRAQVPQMRGAGRQARGDALFPCVRIAEDRRVAGCRRPPRALDPSNAGCLVLEKRCATRHWTSSSGC